MGLLKGLVLFQPVRCKLATKWPTVEGRPLGLRLKGILRLFQTNGKCQNPNWKCQHFACWSHMVSIVC